MLKAHSLLNYFIDFAKYYHEYRIKAEKLASVKYRVITTLEEYKKNKLIELAFTDKPADVLSPMAIAKIKSMPDIIAGMHPVDVNSINDLFYLSQDEICEIKVFEKKLIALDKSGKFTTYNISDDINPDSLKSKKLAYMIGYMKAEELFHNFYKEEITYKIIKDNISSLYIKNIETDEILMKNPTEILFSKEYAKFSKDDIAKIGYICGQMSRTY